MRREVDKWNHVAVLENVSHSRHGGKENTVVERSEVKHREYGGGEQGADVEVGVPGRRVVVLRSMGHPCVEVVLSYVAQEPQPVDEEGGNEVYPSPSPADCQTLACSNRTIKDGDIAP